METTLISVRKSLKLFPVQDAPDGSPEIAPPVTGELNPRWTTIPPEVGLRELDRLSRAPHPPDNTEHPKAGKERHRGGALRLRLLFDYYLGGLLLVLLKLPTVLLGKILKRDHDLEKCTSVTFIKMMGGGSLVIAYPALLAIRKVSRIKTLRIVTSPAVRPFAEMLGIFDEIVVVRDGLGLALIGDSLVALRRIFRTDAVVDLEIHSRLTTVFSLLSCAHNRIGFYTGHSLWRRRLSTHLLFCNLSSGIYHFYEQIAILFQGATPEMQVCSSAFRKHLAIAPYRPNPALARWALAPCCSDLSRERMLRPQEWIDVLTYHLRQTRGIRSLQIRLLGGPGDRAELDELADLIRLALPGVSVENDAGKCSLADSVRKLAQVDRLFCIDSALLHFARLLGVPTSSFWGPTAPDVLLRPSASSADSIYYHRLPCSPCVHIAQEAPCGGNNVCMRLAVDGNAITETNRPWVIAENAVTRFGRHNVP